MKNFEYNRPKFHRDARTVVLEMSEFDGLDAVRYGNLSEDVKTRTAGKLLGFVFNKIEKNWEQDPVLSKIMGSRGSLRVIKEHDLFESSLREYSEMTKQSAVPSVREYAKQLNTLNDFIKANESIFNSAFRTDHRIIMFYYSSLVTLLYHGFAYILSITLDVSKDGQLITGVFQDEKNVANNVLIANLETISKQIDNKQAQEFLSKALEDDGKMNINEDMGLTAFVLASAGIVAATIWFMRDLIEYMFIFRNTIADWFDSYALFLEMRNASLASSNKGAASKQKAIAKKFRAVASKFVVENETANKEAIKRIGEQNKNIDLKELKRGGFDNLDTSYII